MPQVTSPATPVSEDEYTLLSDCGIGLDYVFMKPLEQTISEPKNVKNISYFTSSETTSSSQSCQVNELLSKIQNTKRSRR